MIRRHANNPHGGASPTLTPALSHAWERGSDPRHASESWHPVAYADDGAALWIPVFTGMTADASPHGRGRRAAARRVRGLLPTLALTLLALAAIAASGALAPLTAQAAGPGGVSSVTLTRADGTVTATWDAVDGATKYHVTYTTDGGSSWHAPVADHTNVPTNTLTFDADNAKTYIVGVRAGNDHGWGGWRNSAAAGPFTPPPPPGAVASVSVTRSDGSLTASWDAPAHAAAYHVTYRVNGSGNWLLASLDHASTSIEIGGVDNAKTYIVGVRARNSANAWSGWRNSPAAGPFVPPTPTPTPTPVPAPERPTGLTATAGNGSVTLAWDDASGPAVTGYEYSVRYAGVAWSAWTAVAGSVTTATVDGLTNGTEHRFKLRAVNASGESKPAPAAAPWYVAATPAPPPPPPAPTGLSVDPGEGYLDIEWDAVSEATGYDVRAKAEGASDWHDVAGNVSGTSYTYTTSNTMDYVGVRARNANGASAWTDVSRTPSADWLTTVQQGGASAQSVQPLAKLNAPTWGTITRRNAHPHTLYLNWTAVTGATGYNVVCSDTDGWKWWQCGSITSGTTTKLTVSSYSDGDTLGENRSYKVAVRAVTGNASDASDWVNSANIRPVVGNLSNLVATRGNGSITLTWKPNYHTTGYNIDCAAAESGQVAGYTRCATLTGQNHNATSHTATVSSWTAGGTDYTIDNTKTYDIQIISTNTWGQARALVPLVRPITLTSSNITATSATLTLANYTGSWWLKPTAPADAACKSMGTAATGTVSDLTGSTAYTYKAYSDSSCANEIVSAATFTALSYPSVSNLSATSDGYDYLATFSGRRAATGFTTAAAGNGYTLRSVTVKINSVSAAPTDTLTVAIHEESGGDPAASATHTLSGADPTGAGEYTFTCSGTCTLDDSTTYFLVLWGDGRDSGRVYHWDTTASTSETNTPSGFGWTIANSLEANLGSGWINVGTSAGIFKVSATANAMPTLDASNVGVQTATLTITDRVGDWYYKADAAPHTACQSKVAAGTKTKGLTGLSANTTYTYEAYSDSGCTTANKLATASAFRTLASVSTLSTARKGDSAISGVVTKQASAFTAGSGNTGGYVLKTVTLPLKKVSGTGGLTVTLEPMQGTGSYSETSVPDSGSTKVVTLSGTAPTSSSYTNTTFTCSGDNCKLDPGKTYFIVASRTGSAVYDWKYGGPKSETKLPSNNGFDMRYAHDQIGGSWTSTAADFNLAELVFAYGPHLASSSVTASGATLAISNYHDGDWYYKADAAPHTSCQGPVSGTSTTLSGLTGGTTYTYTAYSDSACTDAKKLATASAFATTPNAPTGLNLSFVGGTNTMHGYWDKPSGMTGSVTYEIQSVNSNRNNPYGGTTTASYSAARVDHNFGTSLTVKFRVRTKVGNATSAWAEHTS